MVLNPLPGSLRGIVALDFGQLIAGPVCGMWLADLGATVIKVEPPGGELARRLGPPWHHDESLTALTANRNKQGLCVDLKRPEGVAVIHRLVRGVDLVVENFRPGVTTRLGIDHAALSAIKPDLITCSLSAFGQGGPWRDRPGVDGILQAATGLMSGLETSDGGPAKVPLPLADMNGALFATIAVLAALHRRTITGEGAHLDVSLYSTALMLQQLNLAAYLGSGNLPAKTGSAAPYAALNEALPARDGWIMVAAYQDHRWRQLCEVVGRPDLVVDPRFRTNEDRVAARAELVAILAPIFRQRTRAEWTRILEAADILVASVADHAEVSASEQYAASGVEIAIEHPAGAVRMPGFALGGPASAVSPPPRAGEHSREVLARFGFAAPEIDALVASAVVSTGEVA